MSCVCILTPVVVAAWPQFSAAVVAAAVSLGYTVEESQLPAKGRKASALGEVELEIPKSQITQDRLKAGRIITVSKDGFTITFTREERGRAAFYVAGRQHTRSALEDRGKEFCQRVVQRYVYQRLMEEIQARQFVVVEEMVEAGHAIRLRVRHWER